MFLLEATIATEIFQVCIVPILGALTAFLINFINKKTNEVKAKTNNELVQKALTILETTVINAVQTTNQTYVDSLKKENIFDVNAQKKAFEETYKAVVNSLTEDTKKGLEQITNELPLYITQLIEAKVKELK